MVRGQNKVVSPFERSEAAPRDIPSSVDWRSKGVVPPVVDQGECGDSSLFAILDSIDAIWAINNGHLVMASREECIDCCLKNGCNGHVDNGISIYQCIVRLGGLAREDEYSSPNHTCLSDKYPAVVKISGARSVASLDEQALAVAVARQPVTVTVDASHQSFHFYKSGIYYEPSCSSEKVNQDHAMLVVGYGSENGQDYWIVKNSWGKNIQSYLTQLL